MKRVVYLICYVMSVFFLCACSQNIENNASLETEVLEAKMLLDERMDDYKTYIDDSVLVENGKKSEYDCYKYTMYVKENFSNEYQTIYDILANVRSGVMIGENFVLLENRVICNKEEYLLKKIGDNYKLEKLSDSSWSWEPYEEVTDKYSSLTNAEKKAICNYIQDRYDYYDSVNGGYAGDKYSDTIMQEAAKKYGITEEQAYIIWMNMYSY